MNDSGARAKIRNPVETDEPQMVDLLVRAFHGWPHFEIQEPALEHLRWKMGSDPIAGRHHFVSEIDGKIVAMMVRIVRRVRLQGRDYLVRDSVDAAVDPSCQDQRLYALLLDHALENPWDSEFGLGFWYTTNPRVQRRNLRQGRKSLGNPVQVLHKPCRARAIVARRHEKYGGRVPAPLAVLRIQLETAFQRLLHFPYWRRLKTPWSINTLDRFDDRIEGFFEEAARPFDFVVVRSRDYLNWRYFDPAAGRFTARVAEQDGRILGYLVFKISEGGGYIADLLALPERLDVVRSLIEDALRLFREARVELASCWMISRHPYNGILRRYGFIDSRSRVGVRYQSVSLDDADLEFLTDADARIHLAHGDSDWV